jgi:hypothetical protein
MAGGKAHALWVGGCEGMTMTCALWEGGRNARIFPIHRCLDGEANEWEGQNGKMRQEKGSLNLKRMKMVP